MDIFDEMKMECTFCGELCGQWFLYVEEYCHHCGDWPVCGDCLETEWCPTCMAQLRKEIEVNENET